MNLNISKEYSINNNSFSIKSSDNKQLSIELFNRILEILKIEKIKTISEYYENLSSSMFNQKISWKDFLSANRKKEYNDYLKSSISNNLKFVTDYFYKYFPTRLKLFKRIYHLDADNPSIYKHSSTTGRLSIEKGINYLVMKKERRNKLVSPLKNHNLFEVDFKSCEPNLYCRYFGLIPEDVEDLYVFISEKINHNFKDRNKLKRAILSILYGANENSVSKISSIPVKKIKKIKEILDLKSFEESLRNEFNSNGFMKNMFGRPILSDSNLVNYWIQSSAADFCCLAFEKFISENTEFKLHAVIHDAIIISCPDISEEKLLGIKSLEFNNLSIPVKINRIRHNI